MGGLSAFEHLGTGSSDVVKPCLPWGRHPDSDPAPRRLTKMLDVKVLKVGILSDAPVDAWEKEVSSAGVLLGFSEVFFSFCS